MTGTALAITPLESCSIETGEPHGEGLWISAEAGDKLACCGKSRGVCCGLRLGASEQIDT
jgi:hypothetical protein